MLISPSETDPLIGNTCITESVKESVISNDDMMTLSVKS